MKKRIIAVILTLVLIMALFTACGNSTKTPAQTSTTPSTTDSSSTPDNTPADTAEDEGYGDPITLTWGHPFSATTNSKGREWQKIADSITEATGGAVTVDVAADGTICDDSTTLDAVMTNVTQIGALSYAYLTGIMPEVQPLCIPGWFSGSEEEYLQFNKDTEAVLSSLFEKNGLKYLGADFPSWSAIFGNGQTVTSPEDLKGKIMRVSGIDQTNAIEAWGGAATVIGLGDLTTALDRGTVDGAFSSLSIVHVFHFNEIVDYVTALPTFEPAHCFFMTLDQWNALNEAQQNAIIEGFKDADKNIYEASMAEEYEPYIAEYKESGCDVVELTAEEFKAFTDLLRPNFEALKENNTEEGLEILRIVYEYNGWEF